MARKWKVGAINFIDRRIPAHTYLLIYKSRKTFFTTNPKNSKLLVLNSNFKSYVYVLRANGKSTDYKNARNGFHITTPFT